MNTEPAGRRQDRIAALINTLSPYVVCPCGAVDNSRVLEDDWTRKCAACGELFTEQTPGFWCAVDVKDLAAALHAAAEDTARQLADSDEQLTALTAAIRRHRDARGDDRCWMDDETLYGVLPEGYTPPARDSAVELARCQQFIASRQNPATIYVSPEREIEILRAGLARILALGPLAEADRSTAGVAIDHLAQALTIVREALALGAKS